MLLPTGTARFVGTGGTTMSFFGAAAAAAIPTTVMSPSMAMRKIVDRQHACISLSLPLLRRARCAVSDAAVASESGLHTLPEGTSKRYLHQIEPAAHKNTIKLPLP